MEVPGSRGSSDQNLSCQPCQSDGDTVQAEGYCENCNQFICTSCIKAHGKLAGTKNHVIISEDEMPKFLTVQSDPCTELCDVHKNEIVNFYCKEHDSVGCGDCMVLGHTSCKIQLVSDVSCNYDDSDELVLIKHRIDHIQKNLNFCRREIKSSLKTANEIKTSIIKEIIQFRTKMDAYLDSVTKDLIQEVEMLIARDVARQQKLEDQCETTANDIEKMQRKLEQCKDKVNDLFVSSKRLHNTLHICQEMNEAISAKSQIYTITFTPTKDLLDLKLQNTRLGNLDTQVKKFSGHCEKSIIDMKTHFVQKFDIKGEREEVCYISGTTTLSESEILCAECNNMSLKILNHKKNKITSTLKTSCTPIDVTTINSSSAAATLFNEGKILILNTQNGLTMSHSINVRGNCYGIDHHNGIMTVTFLFPPAVKMIDMEGGILHEVKDTSILKRPEYVCMSNDNESIFVSDCENHAVYEFTLQGHLKNTIKSDEMKEPTGISVTNCGSVVVCDPYNSGKVGVIVSGTTKMLPLYVHNVEMPRFILICEEQKKIFISKSFTSEDADYIKMLDLK